MINVSSTSILSNTTRTKVVHPVNLGWLEKKLSDQEMDYLWRCIENKKDDTKHTLAGNITGSYELMDRGDWFFENTIIPLIGKYEKEFINPTEHLPLSGRHPFYMHPWWVNYQRQTEFNPLHDHNGVYSFVIWMKIPTHFNQQRNQHDFARGSNSETISNFEFSYTNLIGESMTWKYRMSPEFDGTMVFFSSKLKHQVYPFYNCDDERISISGNILLNTTKRL